MNLLQKLNSLPCGTYPIAAQIKNNFLFFEYRRTKTIGYVFIEDAGNAKSIMTMSHKDHHAKSSEFPCVLALFDSETIRLRADHLIGRFMEIGGKKAANKFDLKLGEILNLI